MINLWFDAGFLDNTHVNNNRSIVADIDDCRGTEPFLYPNLRFLSIELTDYRTANEIGYFSKRSNSDSMKSIISRESLVLCKTPQHSSRGIPADVDP